MKKKSLLFSLIPVCLLVKLNTGATSVFLAYKAPWYFSTYAIVVYIIILISFIFIYRQFLINREKRRALYQIKEMEAQRWKELDTLKSSFFANISHELRTPLTLIMSSLQNMMEEQMTEKKSSMVKIMFWNTNRLIFMINQIMDLSKLDAGKMKLKVSEIKLEDLLQPILLSFQGLTSSSTKVFEYEINDADTILYCDVDKIEKVMSNLLSNAFKYTGENGMISCRCRKINYVPENIAIKNVEEYVELAVFDNGKGIPIEVQDKIFERFYTYHHTFESSTGIGLSLTKEFVTLHGGNIKVESNPGLFTVFYVYLPLGKQHLHNYEMLPKQELKRNSDFLYIDKADSFNDDEVVLDAKDEEHQTILIIEDNSELRNLMAEMLKKYYRIITAPDGRKGLEMAINCMPDLIISDIMMPHINGFKLCEQLKNDLRTSHIPIIILTAKAANEDKLKGLTVGADDYIIKPFQNKEILLKVKNLLNYRQKLKTHYRNYILGNLQAPNNDLINKDKFLSTLREVLDKNYTDNSFNVDAFAEKLGISRVQLHRKLKTLTNQTTSDFIRNYRLEKAKDLIKSNNYSVAQVAYLVGFTHPSYFTESFKKYFGTVPTSFEKD